MDRWLDFFASANFRDEADRDYLVARFCYRQELEQQFLWSALQAVEKYLKAILLFNRKDTRDIGHGVARACKMVQNISYLQFVLPENVVDYIDYLNEFGCNRYVVKESVIRPYALENFDHTVWYIRRYCIRVLERIPGSNPPEYRPHERKLAISTHPRHESCPYKYKFPEHGYLEKIVEKKLEQSNILIWHNNYFGRRQKPARFYGGRVASVVRPIYYLYPECYEELAKYVKLPSIKPRPAADRRRKTR